MFLGVVQNDTDDAVEKCQTPYEREFLLTAFNSYFLTHFGKRHSENSDRFYDQSPPLEVSKAEWVKP